MASTFDTGDDGSLLNSRRLFETARVETPHQIKHNYSWILNLFQRSDVNNVVKD